jgi:uncharacterized protein YndB with AHSA1/START domain
MKTTGSMRALDQQRGAIRVEDVYATDIDDLWDACTEPERLARWIAKVSGDLRVGGTIHATFTSTWTGPGRIDACERPHHLLLTMQPETEHEAQIEAWLATDGDKTRLVIEERGPPPRPTALPRRRLAGTPRRPRPLAGRRTVGVGGAMD